MNLASRIADLAIPHEILVTAQVRADAETTTGSLQFAPAGRRMLKGFHENDAAISSASARGPAEPMVNVPAVGPGGTAWAVRISTGQRQRARG